MREFPSQQRLNWDGVFELKRRWKTSAAAIIRRAFELGRIDVLEYRRAWKHYMYRRWHEGEPDEPDDEVPELVLNALKVLEQSRGEIPHDIASKLGWPSDTFERVIGIAAPPPLLNARNRSEPLNNVVSIDRYRRDIT